MANIVVVSGQFNSGGTSFADSPVIIRVSNLSWPTTVLSPFTIVRIEVKDNGGNVVGEFRADTAQQTEISFDISSALRAIWAGYDFTNEVDAAVNAGETTRSYRSFSLSLFTEYLNTDGYFEVTNSGSFPGGSCAIGWLTEWERKNIGNADMSSLNFTNNRYGDASTKPMGAPERVGRSSITSWVDLNGNGTKSHFYPASATPDADSQNDHAPIVLRDDMDYIDFLFVNRRGAVETCSGRMLEAMDITAETKVYSRVERPTFAPSRSLMALRNGGPRRSWQMSSGFVDREWADWWVMEFLLARQWWMKYKGSYVPVIVEGSKKDVSIYDLTKQQMPHVDFTVTLALEG